MAADVLDRLFSSTLARIASKGATEDTLLDRLMQRELELLTSIWDGRRGPTLSPHAMCLLVCVSTSRRCDAALHPT